MNRTHLKGILCAIGMMVLILDSKTACVSAAEGIALCLYTVIPSLFPFIILSYILTNSLSGITVPLLQPLNRLCGITAGSESYFLVGILGGYPTGAACITQDYIAGRISRREAEQLLGFCSNAGPAFLFGMAGRLFTSAYISWILWGIHIFSALLSGHFLKSFTPETGRSHPLIQSTPNTALSHTLSVMASICGWIVLFRIIIGFLSKWFLWLLPLEMQCLIAGIFELSNGCCSLTVIPSESTRFIILSCLLAFGGICITMQTVSVTNGLSLKKYVLGKVLQTLLSLVISSIIIPFIFPDALISTRTSLLILLILAGFLLIYSLFAKKTVAIPANPEYNVKKL